MKLPRLEALDRSAFTTLVLSLLCAAAWLGAAGLESHVDLRRRLAAADAQQAALSPLAYRAPLPTLAAALDPRGTGWTTVVRVDGLRGETLARACALADAPPAGVRLLALSDDEPGCPAGPATLSLDDLERAMLAVEIRSARWILLDDAGRARYSRRTPPTADELTRTLAAFRATDEARGRTSHRSAASAGSIESPGRSRSASSGDARDGGDAGRWEPVAAAGRGSVSASAAIAAPDKRRVRIVRAATREPAE